MNRTFLASVPCLLAALAVPACSSSPAGDSDTSVASEAVDTSDQSMTEGSVLAVTIPTSTTASVDTEIASAAVTSTSAAFTLPACVKATTVGATVTYTFDDCTGPWGLVSLNGTLAVTYSVVGGAINASFKSSDLTVGKASLEIDATAKYSTSSAGDTLVVSTKGSGVGSLGNSVSRSGSYTVTWNPSTGCVDLDGSWSTKGALDRTWSTSVTDYEACTGSCPKSGTVVYTGGITGTTLTIDFTGSASASFSLSSGQSGEVTLLCSAGG